MKFIILLAVCFTLTLGSAQNSVSSSSGSKFQEKCYFKFSVGNLFSVLNLDSSVIKDDFESEFLAYPNPVKDFIHIETAEGDFAYTVHDVAGKLIFNGVLSKRKYRIDLSHLSTGTYILSIYSGRSSLKSIRLIKE